MKKWMIIAQRLLCAAAMFMAVHSIGVICQGKYYQPQVPEGLEKYKKFN